MYQLHSAIGQDQRQLFLYKITIPALASQNPAMCVTSHHLDFRIRVSCKCSIYLSLSKEDKYSSLLLTHFIQSICYDVYLGYMCQL